ncbi:MAG: hypothetical protein RL348_920, partial [Bacteroidota bacterium]
MIMKKGILIIAVLLCNLCFAQEPYYNYPNQKYLDVIMPLQKRDKEISSKFVSGNLCLRLSRSSSHQDSMLRKECEYQRALVNRKPDLSDSIYLSQLDSVRSIDICNDIYYPHITDASYRILEFSKNCKRIKYLKLCNSNFNVSHLDSVKAICLTLGSPDDVKELNYSFTQLPQVEYLTISLHTNPYLMNLNFPQEICEMKNLKGISIISESIFVTFPENISDLKNLEYLKVSTYYYHEKDTVLVNLPLSFQKLKKLKVIEGENHYTMQVDESLLLEMDSLKRLYQVAVSNFSGSLFKKGKNSNINNVDIR